MDTAKTTLEMIQSRIFTIRGERVMLDSDLAEIYGVTTKRLIEQMKRNQEKFPKDFCFQIDNQELANLRSHFATSSLHGGRRYLPHVFTDHGAVMLATVLNSPQAVEMSVFVVRAFVQMRTWLQSNRELASKLMELEKKVAGHDGDIQTLLQAIRSLMAAPPPPRRTIKGFAGEST
ncbi:MAG: ORF6N domain-containing protein [Verrucomicrobiae bacterium]|nr:ORF6N domain-containing protein [Verrucomicrobiae bacterium]